MSYNCYARIIYGFKTEIEQLKKSVTKYNEEDGQPYQIEVDDYSKMMIEGKEVATDKSNPDCFCEGEEIEGLELTKIDPQSFIGITRHLDDHEFDEVTEIPRMVKDFAKEHGFTASVYFVCKGG